MIFQAVNPTVPNTITELFLLPVQYVLYKTKQSKTIKYINSSLNENVAQTGNTSTIYFMKNFFQGNIK